MIKGILFSCGLLLLLHSPAFAAENQSKFPPISGEIYGKLIPGVKSLSVNGQPVAIGPDQSFTTKVSLKEGQKYLALNINFEGLKIIKKYLILRQPKITTFKVYVPKEEIKKSFNLRAVIKKPAVRKAKKLKRRPVVRQPKPPQLICEYLYVWEFDRGKLLLAKERQGKYSAEVYIPKNNQWYDFKELSRSELQEILEENLPPKKARNKK